MPPRILIVEPDERLRESLCLHLLLEAYQCETRASLDLLADRAPRDRFDLAVVDLAAASRGLRHLGRLLGGNAAATLLLAGPDRRGDALTALEAWADDYVILPIEMCELVARVRALLRQRRVRESTAGNSDGPTIVRHGLLIDPARRRVEVGGHPLRLTEQEFLLLQTLAGRPGVVFTREVLLSMVWGAEISVTPRSIDALVVRLRRRLRSVPSDWEIATVRGVGYQFRDASRG